MNPDRPRPPRLHRPPEPTPPGMQTVIFRMVSGPDVTIQAAPDQVTVLKDELRATWRGERMNSFTFHGPTGSEFLLNPAHIVLMDIR
jgi:hypothetical protein